MAVFWNFFFFVFHSAIILFILTGWIWRRTRPIHIAVVLLTAFSWFILGVWYGFGYCPSTDWHWQVRWDLGYRDMPSSYLVFLFRQLTGRPISQTLMDVMAVSALTLCTGLSLALYFKDRKRQRSGRPPG